MSSGWFRGMVQQVLGFIEPNSVRISPQGTSGRVFMGAPIGVEIERLPLTWPLVVRDGVSAFIVNVVGGSFVQFMISADGIQTPGFFVQASDPSTISALGVLDMNPGGAFRGQYTLAPADGAIAVRSGTVVVTKALAAALTLAAPAVADDGKQIVIIAGTAAAHVLVNAAPGFNGGGAGADTATFGGAIGDGLVLVAHNGVWLIVSSVNVTLS